MRGLALFVIAIPFLLSCPIFAAESFRFSGKIKCELSATFIVFDFDNKTALRNNYNSSQYKLSNYETKRSKFKKTVHTFSWYDMKDYFLGYWVISDDSENVEEIKFDREGKMFSVTRTCSKFNNSNIGELVWE
jgi:hypothetical protein|tara:strand:- start:1000 stop:1398 length:399 start_codon:yes stop_codon:yes gene_type:complete